MGRRMRWDRRKASFGAVRCWRWCGDRCGAGTTSCGEAKSWRRAGWHRWVIGAGEADLLSLTAVEGLVRSSVRITAQQDVPEPTGTLLCLIGGFLALRELQAEIDGSAGVGGVVATAAG